VSQVQGVLLAHWDHSFLDETLSLINECPFGVADIEFDTLIWAPKLGQRLCRCLLGREGHDLIFTDGKHSLSSPSHLSLLFSSTFNVSIPLQHIPQDIYEFEATDPDDAEDEEESDSEDGLVGISALTGHSQVEEVGRWKMRSTGELVGGFKGVEFTVIG
jgi:DNA-directed RNA polymerase I subunit RPA43